MKMPSRGYCHWILSWDHALFLSHYVSLPKKDRWSKVGSRIGRSRGCKSPTVTINANGVQNRKTCHQQMQNWTTASVFVTAMAMCFASEEVLGLTVNLERQGKGTKKEGNYEVKVLHINQLGSHRTLLVARLVFSGCNCEVSHPPVLMEDIKLRYWVILCYIRLYEVSHPLVLMEKTLSCVTESFCVT